MRDKPLVVVGLVVALAVLTFPFWYAVAGGRPEPPPKMDLPDGKCLVDDMRARHMDLLEDWREEVVREGVSDLYESENHPGKFFERSLTKTCVLECHRGAAGTESVAADPATTSEKRFCQGCHDYAGVQPNCWDCHVGP